MSRAGYDTADRENTFGLALPQKRAVEIWFADEWGRLVANIDNGKVIVIVSPSAIFPLDGSMTMPPASGFAFDFSSSCSSSCAKPAPAKLSARRQTRNRRKRRNGESANRRYSFA